MVAHIAVNPVMCFFFEAGKGMRKLVVLMAALLAAAVLRGQLRICGSCGREDSAGGETCAYCQERLPEAAVPPATVAASGQEGSPEVNLATRAFDLARKDVLAARDEELRRPEVALALFENARALLAAVDPALLPPETGTAVLDGLQRCRGALAVAGQACPACGGSGRQRIVLQQLAGGAGTGGDEAPATRATGASCTACGGKGTVAGTRDVETTRLLILQGRREAGLRLQAAGRVAAGQAWLPPEWAQELMPRALAAVRRMAAAGCPACAAIGLARCKACSGTGRRPCTNRKCRDGWVEEKTINTLTPKTALTRRVKCPMCQGTATLECKPCRGRGAVACEDCKGAGLAVPCRTCGGEGVVPCKACRKRRSAAEDGSACPVCRDSGSMLCGRCQGDGGSK